jgi:hypothetical protein
LKCIFLFGFERRQTELQIAECRYMFHVALIDLKKTERLRMLRVLRVRVWVGGSLSTERSTH